MSVHKTAGFLSLNRISELVWDCQSYEAGAASGKSSEDEGGFEDESGVSNLQPNRPTERVKQFVFFKCLWWRGNFSEWARSTGPNTVHFAVDMVFWPSKKCNTHISSGPKGAKRQWSATYKMTVPVHLTISCWMLWKFSHCWWCWLRDSTTATWTELTTDLRPSLTWNAGVSCDNTTNGTLHAGQTGRLTGDE
jgi:hypothetical protein